ncbi:MAG: ATP-binding protein [Desulfobacterales bacterium]|jgi:signal transduction histidine kinase
MGKKNSIKKPTSSTNMTGYDEQCQVDRDLVENNRILKCQYKIAQIAVEDWRSFDTALQAIIELVPHGFEFPEEIAAAIQLKDKAFQTPRFKSSKDRYGKEIVVDSKVVGRIEVGCIEADKVSLKDWIAYSPGQKELIETAARKVAFVIERKEAEEKKQKLEEQLRHADRLATIGQLAAGIAHELNNPLGDILGFAQLASNHQDLPEQTYQDLYRIVKSTLYAREVIKKILLFSRQSVPHEGKVNLNSLIKEWVDFFTFRCRKNGIEMVVQMDQNLPDIEGDSSQINQVIVNLVVNAIHAMPDGGKLTIATTCENDGISLKVMDTGTGIEEDIKDKVFLPFFTTKDVDQGTGLGLSVVYGIVQEHGGVITLSSRVGEGTSFIIKFKNNSDII